jgi:hypothetical protein
LVYSYFFFWTAILAWLCFLALLNFLFTAERRDRSFWIIIFGGAMLVLVPYFFLLSNRNSTTDAYQVLEQTRKIVLLRPTLIFGVLMFLITLIGLKFGLIKLKNQTVIFIISFALLPLLVFNQQIVTGYSLQPMHYNMYILNFLNLVGFILLFNELGKDKLDKIKPFVWIISATAFCLWGIIETNYTTQYRFPYNVRRDEAILVNRHLAQLGQENFAEAKSQITLNLDSIQGDNQPSLAPQGVLWATLLLSTGNLSEEETIKRYFLFLYFQNVTADDLRERFKVCPNETCRALLGWGVNPTLSITSNKIDRGKIAAMITKYQDFVDNLKSAEALNPTLSYIIVPHDFQPDFTNIDRWYEKEKSEQFGNFTLYKVKPIAR